MKPLLSALVLAAGLTACMSTAEAAGPPDGEWTVAAIGTDATAAGTTAPSLTIDGTMYSGSTGCNRYFGTVAVTGDTIAFSAPATTRVLCTDPATADQESRLLAALGAVTTFRADGPAALDLLATDGTTALSLAAPPVGVDVTIHIDAADTVSRQTIVYDCTSFGASVDYINAGPTSLAVLHLAGESVVMVNVIAASGARYVGGQYVWWSKGSGADFYDLMHGGEDTPAASCLSVDAAPG